MGPIGLILGYTMYVPFPHEDVVATSEFDFSSVFGIKQHPISHSNVAQVRPCSNDRAPRQTPGDHSRSRDDDAAAGTTLAAVTITFNKESILQQPNR